MKQSLSKGGAERLSLPTLAPGAHQRTVSASAFPTSWAASVTSQPQDTSFYPWIITFMKLSMQRPFLALHPWYVPGFLGVTWRMRPYGGWYQASPLTILRTFLSSTSPITVAVTQEQSLQINQINLII